MFPESLSEVADVAAPRTDFGAYIASEDPLADLRSELRRNGSAVLDGLIADARSRVDLPRRDDGTRRTGVEARRATPAGARRRAGGRRQVGVQDQLSEEEPRAEARMEKVGSLGFESQPGLGRVRALEERTCIHDAPAASSEARIDEPAV